MIVRLVVERKVISPFGGGSASLGARYAPIDHNNVSLQVVRQFLCESNGFQSEGHRHGNRKSWRAATQHHSERRLLAEEGQTCLHVNPPEGRQIPVWLATSFSDRGGRRRVSTASRGAARPIPTVEFSFPFLTRYTQSGSSRPARLDWCQRA